MLFVLRYCRSIILALLFSVTGYLLSPVKTSHTLPDLAWWLIVTAAYLLFWFGIAWLVVSIKQNSSVSALLLVGFWLLFLLVIPSLVNNYVAANYKISSRTALVNELRKQTATIWDMPDSITVLAFYKDYPQYAQVPFMPLWSHTDSFDSLGKNETMDKRYNKKIYVWHYYLDKMIETKLGLYNKQLADKQSAADKFSFINPVVTTQEALNDIAASGYHQQQRFKNACAAYRDSIFNLSAKYIFEDKKLTLEDYKSYPVFNINKYAVKSIQLFPILLMLTCYTLIGFVIGYLLFKNRT